MKIHSPKNEQPICEIHAVVQVDADGNEGIAGVGEAGVMMLPLVVGYPRLVPMLREAGKQVAKQTGKKLKLVRFTVREDLETYEP